MTALARARAPAAATAATVTRYRLAAFGGVYSNAPALVAVLDDAASLAPDATWCLGDLGGFGPHPDNAIDVMRNRGIPSLRGNYDDSIGHDRDDCACGYTAPRDRRFAARSFAYTRARTSSEHKTWLRALPAMHRMMVAGRRVLLCHGSPRRMNEFLWESTCSDAFLEWLCDVHAADLVVCSHTGLAWHRELPSGRHVVNAGAIGRPPHDGGTGAVYAVIEIAVRVEVEWRRVAYDHEAVACAMEVEGLPAEFIDTIRTGWWTTCVENLPARERLRGRG